MGANEFLRRYLHISIKYLVLFEKISQILFRSPIFPLLYLSETNSEYSERVETMTIARRRNVCFIILIFPPYVVERLFRTEVWHTDLAEGLSRKINEIKSVA